MLRPIDYFDGLTINLEVSSLCNFGCPYCYERKKAKFTRFFSKQELHIINYALAQSATAIRLIILGGEPYLYPHLDYALELFSVNPKIKEIRIFSNGSYPGKIYKDFYHIFSFHASQDNSKFFDSCSCVPNKEIRILMDKPEKLVEIESELLNLGYKVFPTYIYRPSSEFDACTQRVKLKPKILKCEDFPEFIYCGNDVTRRWVIENLGFNGCKCVQSRFCINNIGNICLGCGPAVDNILKNRNFFRDFQIHEVTCKCKTCAKDMFLEQMKFLRT